MAGVHHFRTELRWRGSTAGGYRSYSRDHAVAVAPAAAELTVSADRAFRGDPALPNPEQLLLAAAASCQLLSFLAVAARAGIDVVDYADRAEAEMAVTREPMRITRITLRPRIVVAAGTDPARIPALVARAHEECFVANTLATEMVIEPTVTVPDPPAAS